MAEYRTMTVEFTSLTEAQALALEDLFALWNYMGSAGMSRWTAFFADGDGNFQPGIRINGERPKRCALTDMDKRWRRLADVDAKRPRPDDFYLIDFDAIAWALHRDDEPTTPKQAQPVLKAGSPELGKAVEDKQAKEWKGDQNGS